ncbi:MAG: rod shape-determining protein MreD [Alphaproteobacteria bacterium]|nr:rod shape-determining protein MreD [Alphaproteobacteria bacterium]
MQSFADYFPAFFRMSVVYLLMFLLFLFNTISIAMPISTTIDVPFIIMVIYYWSIYRPTLISPSLVFAVGICFDLLSGWPVGLNAFIFLLLRHVIVSQRLFLTGQPFAVVWIGFMMAGFVSLSMQWLLFGLIRLQWGSIEPVILASFAAILLFPLIAVILHLSHKALPYIQDQYSAVS